MRNADTLSRIPFNGKNASARRLKSTRSVLKRQFAAFIQTLIPYRRPTSVRLQSCRTGAMSRSPSISLKIMTSGYSIKQGRLLMRGQSGTNTVGSLRPARCTSWNGGLSNSGMMLYRRWESHDGSSVLYLALCNKQFTGKYTIGPRPDI